MTGCGRKIGPYECCTVVCGDCLELMKGLPGKCVNLTLTDPPYNGVLPEQWDSQWETDAEFLGWIDAVVGLIEAASADNSTLYMFASPQLAARVEVRIAHNFRVIGNVVWDKGNGRNGAAGSGVKITALRTYWTANTERAIIGEKLGGDEGARDASGYWDSCKTLKRSIMGAYLKCEFARAGITNRQVAELFPSRTGGMTGCVSNWLLGANLPTAEQYSAMRARLNSKGRASYLRREYEDLRRPFFLSERDQWGDVWRFEIERNRIHPAQKPLALIEQIVRVSSRESSLVFDPFLGSGTTAVAAKKLGRHFQGFEISPEYCKIAEERIALVEAQPNLFDKKRPETGRLELSQTP